MQSPPWPLCVPITVLVPWQTAPPFQERLSDLPRVTPRPSWTRPHLSASRALAPSHRHKGPAHPVRPGRSPHLHPAHPEPSNNSPECSRRGSCPLVPVSLRVCESISGGVGNLSPGGRGVYLSLWVAGPLGAKSVPPLPPSPAGGSVCTSVSVPPSRFLSCLPATLLAAIRGPRAPPADRCPACTSMPSRSRRAQCKEVVQGAVPDAKIWPQPFSSTPMNHRGFPS